MSYVTLNLETKPTLYSYIQRNFTEQKIGYHKTKTDCRLHELTTEKRGSLNRLAKAARPKELTLISHFDKFKRDQVNHF